MGYIRPSKSAFSSPVLFAKKANGKLRLCVDYRELNKNTILDAYPTPLSENLLFDLGGSKFFSKIDLAAAFWQLRVK